MPVPVIVCRVGTRSTPTLLNQLRVARAERDISQDALAKLVGVSRQTISSIETGQYGPSTLLALRLAAALRTPVDRLFWLEEDDDGLADDAR